jgi:two-component system NtrC family response regulator
MSEEKSFRLDLYYRLAEFTLVVPPLRDRDGDIITLSNYLLDSFNADLNTRVKGFSDDAITALVHHHFPGNIRELQNRIKGAIILCDGELINADMLGLDAKQAMLGVPSSWLNDNDEEFILLEDVRREAESKAIFNAYRKSDHNISAAAKMLGVTRPTFYALTEKYGMRLK